MKNIKKIKNFILLIIAIINILFYPNISYAYGIKTTFGKVILEDIPLGATYSMREHAKFPLVIQNESDKLMTLKLHVLIPQENEIQEGYEAIPSVDWIKLEKDELIVAANKTEGTDLTITVPDNKEYSGRKFHVFIWTHTTGESLGVGLKSKLLFTIK